MRSPSFVVKWLGRGRSPLPSHFTTNTLRSAAGAEESSTWQERNIGPQALKLASDVLYGLGGTKFNSEPLLANREHTNAAVGVGLRWHRFKAQRELTTLDTRWSI